MKNVRIFSTNFMLVFFTSALFTMNGCEKASDQEPVIEKPTIMVIDKIILKSFSLYNPNGNLWDDWTNYPDPYVVFGEEASDGSLNILIKTGRYDELKLSDLPVNYTNSKLPLSLTNFNRNLGIGLFDYDSDGGDDFMFEVEFKISDFVPYSGDYPTEIQLYADTGAFTLEVHWK